MTRPSPDPAASESASAESQDSALFASLVMQQTNMALVFLGKVPHPQTGQGAPDLEGASVFIDTLAMLAKKTKGNLSPEENELLQQSLTTLRMSFVEAAARAPIPTSGAAPTAPAGPSVSPSNSTASPAAADSPASGERTKFVKKY